MSITLKFDDLTADTAQALISAYQEIVNRRVPTAPSAPVTAPAPSAPFDNGDPFTANVPARPAAPVVQPPAYQPAASVTNTGAGTVEVDAFGVPYNPALHSVTSGPSKGRNQDGSWKMKKNVKRDEFDAWARQHRAAAASSAPPVAAPTPANLNTQFGAPPVSNGDPFAGAVTPGQAFGSPPPAPLPAVSYEEFVGLCNQMMLAGKLPSSVIVAVKAEIGCDDEQQINNDPNVRSKAFAVLQRINTTGA